MTASERAGIEVGRGRVAIALVVAASLITRILTLGRFETIDEFFWMRRTVGFSDALTGLSLSEMSASTGELATMPGIPTMWLGSVARLIWAAGRGVGLWSSETDAFENSQAGLTIAQLVLAIASSLLIGVLVWLLWRWASPVGAIAAGVLFATEPFWVAHGSILHVGQLEALFGLSGIVALALVLGVPKIDERFRGRTGLAILAGVLLSCAPLSKISGLYFAPGALIILIWAVASTLRSRGESSPADVLAPLARAMGIVVGAAIVTVIVLYPALWRDPSTQFDLLLKARGLGYDQRQIFFRGEGVIGPGAEFYAIAMPFRMTPWALAAVILAVPIALYRRTTRAHALVVLATVAPVAIILTQATSKYDRYGLGLLGICFLFVAVALGAGEQMPRDLQRRLTPVVLIAGLLATVHSALVAPWGLAYFNPALGGGEEAVEQVTVGWQEGQAVAGDRIAGLLQGPESCADVSVWGLNWFLIETLTCGTPAANPEEATFVVLYVEFQQRLGQRRFDEITAGRRLVATVRIRGITYATIWR